MSAGPLSRIAVSPYLNCDVENDADSIAEFYGSTACGTFVAVDGVLYGPEVIPAGNSASPRTAFTPVSQEQIGDGTLHDPFQIITEVALGDTGLRVVQYDTYFTGDDRYLTEVQVFNDGTAARSVVIYRAADCYLGDSDYGLGAMGDDWVACVAADSGRVLQWTDYSGDARMIEGQYNEVWTAVGTQQPFGGSCGCDVNQDNGAGLSWSRTIGAHSFGGVAHVTAFSPVVPPPDSDGDGLSDLWEQFGYTDPSTGEFIDLPALGADPHRADIFLQLDWMEAPATADFLEQIGHFLSFGNVDLSTRPSQAVVDDMVHAFDIAPVNEGREAEGIDPGVTLHVEVRTDPLPYSRYLTSVVDGDYMPTVKEHFETRLTAAEKHVYRYGLVAASLREKVDGGNVVCDGTTGTSLVPGQYFVVAERACTVGLSTRQFSGTIVHELGHSLGLGHGGPVDLSGSSLNCKPGYESVMNYRYQFGGRNGKVMGVDYSRGSISGLHVDEPPACSESNPALIVVGDYDVHEDWSHLKFSESTGIGGLSSGSVAPSDESFTEPTVAAFEQEGLLGGDGDGSATLLGPVAFVADLPSQSLVVSVKNVGNVPADFALAVVSDLGSAVTAVHLEGLQATEVSIPVVAGQADVGSHVVAMTLHAGTVTGPIVATSEGQADVFNPTVNEIASAIEILQQGDPDDSIGNSMIETLGSLLSPVSPGVYAQAPQRLADIAPVAPSHVQCLDVAGTYGVPSDATGVVLNVTAVGASAPGYVVVYPDAAGDGATSPPVASTVNFEAGQAVANSAFVSLPADGRVCTYSQGGTLQRLILDVSGYLVGDAGVTLQAAQRLLDTRPGGQHVGAVTGPIEPSTVRTIQVTGNAGVPAGATAVMANITVTGVTSPGHLRMWAADGAVPNTSVLNFAPGQDKANGQVVSLSANGQLSFESFSGVGALQNPVQVIIDITGYVTSGSTIIATTPTRIVETRASYGIVGPITGALVPMTIYAVEIPTDMVPPGATAVLMNVTAVGPTGPGHLRVYPDSNGDGATPPPNASSINYVVQRDIPNMVLAEIPLDRKVAFYSVMSSSSGRTNLVVDIVGYVMAAIP